MTSKILGAVAICGLMAVAGCSVDGGELLRAGEASGTLVVINGTSRSIDVVSLADCGNFTYGFNRLPSGTSIGSGQSYPFRVSAGCWAVNVGSIGYGDVSRDMNVAAGGVTEYTVHD